VNSQFNDPLVLFDDGMSVEACGPINWKKGEEELELVMVRIRQGLRQAKANVSGTVLPRGAPMWETDAAVEAGGAPLEPGQALAVAVALVTIDGRKHPFRWSNFVQLASGDATPS
jgi:hypothetical protein